MPLKKQSVKTIFMYSGQGSQYYQMGVGLYNQDRIFHQRMNELDHFIHETWGISVIRMLYAADHLKRMPFDDVLYSSLAIFMVEQALTDTLNYYGVQPEGVLSLSMGAFAALPASGVAGCEEMLTALYHQAQVIEHACCEGVMLAILAPVNRYQELQVIRENSEIAAINTPTHFVITLPCTAQAEIEAALTELKIPFQKMPGSRAYHSRWIEPAHSSVLNIFRGISWLDAQCPYYLCTDRVCVPEISAHTLWDIIRGPICLPATIQQLEQQGTYRYVDVGPSGTMATLLKYVLPGDSQSSVYTILNPMGQDQVALSRLLSAVQTNV